MSGKARLHKPKRAPRLKVSLGGVTQEDLPFPVVHYPSHYGTFFAFAETESSTPVLCACARGAVENAVALAKKRSVSVSFDDMMFPSAMLDSLQDGENDLLQPVRFRKGLCHRCNLRQPTWRYCHEMYGTRFVQWYGWYIRQSYLRLGISPGGYDYLVDVCPKELQEDAVSMHSAGEKLSAVREWFYLRQTLTEGTSAGEKTYTLDDLRVANRDLRRARRGLDTKIENITRQEFGFRKVGEGWIGETLLYQIVRSIYPSQQILRHHRPDWLHGLELDIYLPALGLAFEYQGQQHFHPIAAWGGQEALEALWDRDAEKSDLCRQLKIKLVTVDYTEPLTMNHIRDVLGHLDKETDE